MTVAAYVRVSTADQNLDRQLERTSEYAQQRLDAGLGEIETYRDKSTGTNTERSGYRELMADVDAGEVDHVVVNSISRVSRSIRDLQRTVDRLEDYDTALHVVEEGLVLDPNEDDPYQDALFRMLGVFAQLEAEMTQQRVKEGIAARKNAEGYHHGPAPLGFEKDEGELVEGEQYDEVVTHLEMVQKGDLSKRKAASRLDCSRSTVNRALERGELYGL